ncbi:MAG: AAA family ATPase, partial [Actinobacteria bacterium]|nr:AAA family ATPase [Actinomycetota bacterium]
LADFTYEPFAQRAITALEELRLAATEDHIDADLALGRHGVLVAEVEQLIAVHPFRERLRGHLMLALYRAGRQADALEAYQDARRTLVREMGIEPAPALRELQQAILRQDPALDIQPGVQQLAHATDEPQPPSAEARWLPFELRTVTAVLADLVISGEPGADLQALRHFSARPLDVATEVLRRHGARVEEIVGEMLVGFFGFPVAHEDDAVRAVRAAVELRAAIATLNDDPQPVAGVRFSVRTGIETGEVVVGTAGSPRAQSSGQILSVAGRLQQAAAPDDVIVGPATQHLIRGAAVLKPVYFVPEGSVGSIFAWRVLNVVAGAPVVARHLDAPMFGRAAELTRVRTAFRRTIRSDAAYRLTVMGEAGIGKSRLAKEFALSIGADARIITGRCPPYGEGITFLPLREAVLDAAGPRGWRALKERLTGEDDGVQIADQIAGAIGLPPQQGIPDELFPAVRRLFETLASKQPLVVVFEELHWAEPSFLDLIEYLTRRGRGLLFLLCLARPELIRQRPGWGAASPSADTLFVEPLSAAEVEQLVVGRAGATFPRKALRRIVKAAQGHPLFAEQLLAAFNEHNEVMPGSLQSLIAMRLDRLGPGERDLLRCAAVIGSTWDEDTLLALLPHQARPFVYRHLEALEQKRLITRTRGTAFRFAHVLIQLAAYQSMAREDRASLGEQLANWLETNSSESSCEFDEIVG